MTSSTLVVTLSPLGYDAVVVDLDELRQPLHTHRPERGDLHQSFDEPERGGWQPDTPRCGELFHTRFRVGRVSDRRVVDMEIITDGSDHHCPRVEPHPDAHLNAMGTADPFRIALHGGLHRQGGIASPEGMVFMGDGEDSEARAGSLFRSA